MTEVRPALGAGGRVDDAAVAEAAARLQGGRLVAFPTETVYGLGAATLDASAIDAVYALKGRPADNPLIVHVPRGDASTLSAVVEPAAAADPRVTDLAGAFWPGPLTLVLPRSEDVPASASAGRDTVAVRCPRHPVALALLRAFDGPVSAPSANVSGHVSPTTAAHVQAEFPEADLLVLDGGPCDVGVESTVLDLTTIPPRVLRPGSITAADLAAVLGDVDEAPVLRQGASPGTRERHYAPRHAATATGVADLATRLAAADGPRAVVGREADLAAVGGADGPVGAPHRAFPLPDDPDGLARGLYAAVREADAWAAAGGGAGLLLVLPGDADDPAWAAVRDRLRRMTAG